MIGSSLARDSPYPSVPPHLPHLNRGFCFRYAPVARLVCEAVRWSIALLCLCVLPVPALTQGSSDDPGEVELFQKVPTIDGLPGNMVIGITQDHHGYIWIIGFARLFRYDGYQFQCFSHTSADTLLQRWTYRGLTGGRHGILCIYGSGNEIVLYDVDSASSQLFTLPLPAALGSGPVHTQFAIEDMHGRFLVATREGMVFRITPSTGQLETLNGRGGFREPSGHMPIAALVEDLGGNIWAGGEMGIVCVAKTTAEFQNQDLAEPTADILPPDSVVAMSLGRDGKIWVATSGGEFGTLDPIRKSFISLGRVNRHNRRTPVRALVEDSLGGVWIITGSDGLDHWRAGQEKVVSYLCENGRRHTSSTSIRVLFVDRTGLVWIGTWSRGLLTYAPWRRKFHPRTPSGGDLAGLSGAFVTSAVQDRDGTLWIGTMGAHLNYLPRGSMKFRHCRHEPGNSQSLSSREVTCLCQRKNGDLWVGTVGGGISVLKPHGKAFVRMQHSAGDPGSLGADTVNAIFEDKDETVWIGHVRGVDRYEDETGRFSAFIRWPSESVALTGTASYFYRDSRDNFWIATAGRGLLRIGRTPGDSVWYRRVRGRAGTLPTNGIDCLREDELGRLWLGTPAGLSRFDYATGEFHTFSVLPPIQNLSRPSHYENYPSPSLGVVGIIPDQQGNLWLSTTRGIAKYNIGSGVGRVFGQADGMVVREGMRHAHIRTEDGWVFCGGRGGLNWFHPDSIKDNATPPPIAITVFRISGKNEVLSSPDPAAGVLLDYAHNTFSVEFAALDYTEPHRNQFMYMLEGADRDWVPALTRHEVTYANVGPGNYVLRVRGSNSDGVWNETGLSLPIIIEPPFWQSWWFRGTGLLLVGALAYAAHRYRLTKMLALERLRLRIANDLHDDIGSDLSSLALESDLLARRLPEGDPGGERLRAVGRTIRAAADNLRDIVWIVSPDLDTVQDLVERMREVAPKMLTGLQYEFRSSGSSLSGILDVELKRHVLMMFKEMLHNVSRHARATHADLEFTLEGHLLRLCVRDDGIGFDISAHQGGRGLRSLKARASAIGGTLTIESNPGAGTTVCLEADITRL